MRLKPREILSFWLGWATFLAVQVGFWIWVSTL